MNHKIWLDLKQWYQDSYQINQTWLRFLIQKLKNLPVYTVKISDLAVQIGFIVIFKQITSSQKNSMLNFFFSNWHHQQIVFKKIFLGFFLLLIGFNCQHFFREGLQNFPCNVRTCDLLLYRPAGCNPVLYPLLPLQVQFVKWTNLSFFWTTCLYFQDNLLLSIDILSVQEVSVL